MLSGETATGTHPALVVETMRKIINQVEQTEYRYNREEDLKPLMCFKESAASDPELDIIMTMFICKKKMDKVYFTNEEIIGYHFYKIGETKYNLSSAIRDHFIPFAVSEGLLF
jgi:pyruvate kinase